MKLIKEIWYYLKWAWVGCEIWYKIYASSIVLILLSLFVPDREVSDLMFSIGTCVLLLNLLKLLIWDMVKISWASYQRDKKRTIDKLKG